MVLRAEPLALSPAGARRAFATRGDRAVAWVALLDTGGVPGGAQGMASLSLHALDQVLGKS
ncbi:hypothetical protein T484DRAFT_1768101 [Baffinella frigidus]|nr:hypothetical protein T484DRAFT_1768101 [Cryptophyta sp. CCMP2293]